MLPKEYQPHIALASEGAACDVTRCFLQNPKPLQPNTIDHLLTPRQVLDLVRISKTTLYRLKNSGEFPAAVMLGERIPRWRLSEIEAWLASRPRSGGAVQNDD